MLLLSSIKLPILISRSLSTQSNASLVKTITVRPSLRAYEELARISPGRFKMPKKPFDMRIQYIDTSPEDVGQKQTVLALHGLPGSWQHFEKMAKDFHNSSVENVRFIALSFPDFTHTRENGYFWHTTPERVNFVRQFLKDLKIDKIDCLACHSSGVHSAIGLLEQPDDLTIGSIGMFAPHPFWDAEVLAARDKLKYLFLFHNELWYRFLELTKCHSWQKTISMQMKDANEMFLTSCLLFEQVARHFEDNLRHAIQTTETPISVMFGGQEPFVTRENILRISSIMGLENDKIQRLDPKIHTEKDVKDTGRVSSFLGDNAGHFVHIKQHKFAMQIIRNLLAKVNDSAKTH